MGAAVPDEGPLAQHSARQRAVPGWITALHGSSAGYFHVGTSRRACARGLRSCCAAEGRWVVWWHVSRAGRAGPLRGGDVSHWVSLAPLRQLNQGGIRIPGKRRSFLDSAVFWPAFSRVDDSLSPLGGCLSPCDKACLLCC